MKTVPALEPLKPEIPKFKKALILLSSTPNIDSVAAALGLSLALQKKGMEVQVASSSDMRVEFSRLVGVDTVKKKIGNRNLLVSFDYSEEKVEKVSYNISEDGKKFNLVISPKTGATPLDPATVEFDYAGAEADVTFMIGVSSFEELGSLYEEERNAIEASTTVTFTLFPASTFAKIHIDAQGHSSLCELIASGCAQLELPLDADGAGNLLFGMESITQGLTTAVVGPDTFETVAFLMRAGARRQPIGQQGTLSPNQFPYIPSSQSMPQSSSNPGENPSPPTGGQSPNSNVSNNPFASALSKTANQGGTMPAGHSATGELKG